MKGINHIADDAVQEHFHVPNPAIIEKKQAVTAALSRST